MRILWIAVLAIGCAGSNGKNGTSGKGGDAGPQGEQGPAGPAGADASADYRWVDASGAEVTQNPLALWIDDVGYSWYLDLETGEYIAPSSAIGPYFESADCTGDGYVWFSPRPMLPFTISELGDELYVRPKGLPLYEVCHESVAQGAFCVASSDCIDAISVAEVTPAIPIVVPSSPWIGPLHTER